MKTEYRYSVLGQLLEKKTDDATETCVYKGSRLFTHTDAKGITTTIGYDGAGRKISEQTASERIAFAYDQCSRISQKIKAKLITFLEYDQADRLKEERQGDGAPRTHRECG